MWNKRQSNCGFVANLLVFVGETLNVKRNRGLRRRSQRSQRKHSNVSPVLIWVLPGKFDQRGNSSLSIGAKRGETMRTYSSHLACVVVEMQPVVPLPRKVLTQPLLQAGIARPHQVEQKRNAVG